MVEKTLYFATDVNFEDMMPLFCSEYNEGVLKVLRLFEKIRRSDYLEYKNEGTLRLVTSHGTYKFSSVNKGYSITHRLEFLDYSHDAYCITGRTTPQEDDDTYNHQGFYIRHDNSDGFLDMTVKNVYGKNLFKLYDIQNETGFSIPAELPDEQYFQYSLLHDIPMCSSTLQGLCNYMYDTKEYVSAICIRRYIPRQVFTDMIQIVDKLLLDFEWDTINDFQ